MFLRIFLVFLYLIFIFIGARIADFGNTFIGVKSLCVISDAVYDALALNFWNWNENDNRNIQKNCGNKKFSNQLKFTKDSKGHEKDVKLNAYSHFLEHVKDTEASVWVVLIKPSTLLMSRNDCVIDWNMVSKNLNENGIKTGVYDCSKDEQLCKKYKIMTCSILLAIPIGVKPNGQIAIHLYDQQNLCQGSLENSNAICLLAWIKSKLKSKVIMLDSFEELSSLFKYTEDRQHFGLNLLYQSEQKSPPLLFSSLSVKFTGRVKFVQFKSLPKNMRTNKGNYNKSLLRIVDNSPRSFYSYGLKQGEGLEYSSIELFLRTLHPEVNDIFLLTLIFVNMTCLLELFIQKGGPIKKFIYFVWTFTVSNLILIILWLPLTKLLQLPETRPLIEFFLESLQAAMLSNFAAIIRKDILLFSNHFTIFCSGLLIYGMLLSYFKFRIQNREGQWLNLSALLNEDFNEVQQFFLSLVDLATPSLSYYNFEEQLENLLHHITRPSLWLLPLQCTDYIQQLVCWQFCKYNQTLDGNDKCFPRRKNKKCCCKSNKYQSDKSIIQVYECVICLEKFCCGDTVKLLPCKHFFHKDCIDNWLLCGHLANNRKCPVCRLPADLK